MYYCFNDLSNISFTDDLSSAKPRWARTPYPSIFSFLADSLNKTFPIPYPTTIPPISSRYSIPIAFQKSEYRSRNRLQQQAQKKPDQDSTGCPTYCFTTNWDRCRERLRKKIGRFASVRLNFCVDLSLLARSRPGFRRRIAYKELLAGMKRLLHRNNSCFKRRTLLEVHSSFSSFLLSIPLWQISFWLIPTIEKMFFLSK